MEELRGEWDAATSFAEGAVAERWWGVMTGQYTGEGRVYHNHTYLTQLLALHRQHHQKLTNPQAVALAIFFHKCVLLQLHFALLMIIFASHLTYVTIHSTSQYTFTFSSIILPSWVLMLSTVYL